MIKVRDICLNSDAYTILSDLRKELTNGKLAIVEMSGQNDVKITCPFHSLGLEKRPSCFVRNDDGIFHCFVDNEKGDIQKLVAASMDCSYDDAFNWLLKRYANTYIKKELNLEDIDLFRNLTDEQEYLNENVLDSFESYHPYMTKRHLTDDIIRDFEIKYDPKTQSIVFPVRDIKGRLVALTRRNVNSKIFDITKGFNKKHIYCLDKVVKNNIKEVVVVESQINCLTLWCWGIPSIALFGSGTTKEQIDELNNTNILSFILAYDNDDAGNKGAERFISLINKDRLVTKLEMPIGKDVNDLTEEEFRRILNESNSIA